MDDVEAVEAKAVEAAWTLASLSAAMPVVTTELDQMIEQRLLVSLNALSRDVLTPDAAFTTLVVIKTMRDLKMRLMARVKGVNHD